MEDRPEALLDLIVVADFVPGADRETALCRRLHRIDKETLPDLMSETAPELRIAEPDAPESARLETPLCFPDLRAFRPENLAASIPTTRALLRIKDLLVRSHRGEIPPAELAGEIQDMEGPGDLLASLRSALAGPGPEEPGPPSRPDEPSPTRPTSPPAREPEQGGSLFDLVDVDGSRLPRPETVEETAAVHALDRLMKELGGSLASRAVLSTKRYQELEGLVDEAIADIVRPVLHEPAFRALESSWRGLRFLTGRLDFRSGIRLHILSAPPSRMADAVENIVLPFVAETRSDARTAVVALDASVDASGEDLAQAARLATLAEKGRFPVIAAADPGLLGLTSLLQIQTLPPVDEVLEGGGYEAWQALRGEPASRWLTLAVNSFLMRLPYGPESDRVKGIRFEENPQHQDPVYLWGRPVWALAAMIGYSYAQTGWGTEILGSGEDRGVDDLPVRPLELRGGEIVQIPLEMLLPDNRSLELSRAGIVPFDCRRNSDVAALFSAPTVHRPSPGPGNASVWPESARASLPYQLFTAQITAYVEHILTRVDPRSPVEEIARTLMAGLQIMAFGPADPRLDVSAEPSAAHTGEPSVLLHIAVRDGDRRGLPPIDLEVPIRSS